MTFLLRNFRTTTANQPISVNRQSANNEGTLHSDDLIATVGLLCLCIFSLLVTLQSLPLEQLNKTRSDITKRYLFSIFSRHSIIYRRGVSASTDHWILFCRLWKSIIIIYLFIIYRLNGDRLHIYYYLRMRLRSSRENKKEEHVARVRKKICSI